MRRILMMPDYRSDNPYQQLLADGLGEKGVDVVFPSGYRRVFPVARALREVEADGVHLHWPDPYFKGTNSVTRAVYAVKYVVDLLLARQLTGRLVWTVHNLESHDAEYPRIERWLRRRIASIAHALIVHGETTRGLIASIYGVNSCNIHVVPHGHYRDVYDAPPPPEEAREELGVPDKGRLFLHFGMLKPYKGVVDLLDVWPAYHSDHPEDHLVIAGSSQNKEYGQNLRRRAKQIASVTLRDEFIPEHDVPTYFGAADVAVFPFREITTSGSVILALSFGIPVLAPRIGEIGSLVGNADDLLYESSSIENLLRALQRSAKTDLNKLGRATRRVCNNRSWDTIAQATAEVYEGKTSQKAH